MELLFTWRTSSEDSYTKTSVVAKDELHALFRFAALVGCVLQDGVYTEESVIGILEKECCVDFDYKVME